MGFWTSEEITDFIENLVTARTGGTLTLLRSRVRVRLPKAIKGFPICFAFPHDGDMMLVFDVIVEIVFSLGEILNVFSCKALQGDTVFAGERHFIEKRLLRDGRASEIRYRHSTASRSAPA